MCVLLDSQAYSIDYYLYFYASTTLYCFLFFRRKFQNWELESPYFVLFQDGFDYYGTHAIPDEFEIVSTNSAGNLTGMESGDKFGQGCH